ncbi:hypothetical protein [Catenuloplanes indicus]|uniref:Uncharacterized protein n=1 Tax=Catenuloplanes indicus TaxID=137267 RepID=A0AAE3W4Z1_9ACTN|nr:hypothetical protein [Catenuloplanes indicus]MDQ0369380.1 hypothetical protein [Catenuloplanes indicus]
MDEAGFLTWIKVKVDGNLVALLAFAAETSVHLAPGEYEISAEFSRYHGGPLRIAVNEGETDAVRLQTEMPMDLGFGYGSRRDVIRVERE